MADLEQERVTALWREAAAVVEEIARDANETTGAYVKENGRGTPFLYFPDDDQEDGIGYREATVAEWSFWRKCGRLQKQLEAARAEVDRYHRAVVAHHDIGTLSDDVLREYDFQSCPVCVRAALGVVGEQE